MIPVPIRAVLIGVIGLSFGACNENSKPTAPTEATTLSIPFETVTGPFMVGVNHVTDPSVRVFYSQRDWARFWADWSAREQEDAPQGDFDDSMLIALFWGERFEGCGDFVRVVRDVWKVRSWTEQRNDFYEKVELAAGEVRELCRFHVPAAAAGLIHRVNARVYRYGNWDALGTIPPPAGFYVQSVETEELP